MVISPPFMAVEVLVKNVPTSLRPLLTFMSKAHFMKGSLHIRRLQPFLWGKPVRFVQNTSSFQIHVLGE